EQRAQSAETARDESLEHITSLRAENDALREELVHYELQQQELDETIAGLRQELRHANDRLQAAQDRLAKSSEAEDQSVDAQRNAEHVRDLALEDRRSALANLSDLGGILHDLRSLGQRLEAALPNEQAAAERLPLPTPGRLNGNPQGMTIHLLKSTATVIIDGYNVTKGTWPNHSLEQQRELLIAATERLAARFGTHLIIVFDGADIAGAHRENRSLIRVMYSPNGITADDVIRGEVRRLPISRPVVVITDDQAIQRDVRSDGANIVSSAHFSQVLYS
ncbi:MAG: NYN domain-containing protein, partial [Actinomycetota bacterium]|nr:NYN domain-containing protein [Actinomycetota bacterium]